MVSYVLYVTMSVIVHPRLLVSQHGVRFVFSLGRTLTGVFHLPDWEVIDRPP
jgi:hypothetical protein